MINQLKLYITLNSELLGYTIAGVKNIKIFTCPLGKLSQIFTCPVAN